MPETPKDEPIPPPKTYRYISPRTPLPEVEWREATEDEKVYAKIMYGQENPSMPREQYTDEMFKKFTEELIDRAAALTGEARDEVELPVLLRLTEAMRDPLVKLIIDMLIDKDNANG